MIKKEGPGHLGSSNIGGKELTSDRRKKRHTKKDERRRRGSRLGRRKTSSKKKSGLQETPSTGRNKMLAGNY